VEQLGQGEVIDLFEAALDGLSFDPEFVGGDLG